MPVSLSVSIRVLGLSLLLLGFAPWGIPSASADEPFPAATPVASEGAFWTQFSERAAQLTRVLLSAMSAARDQGQHENARCFDRALKQLHSLTRQAAFHSERAQDGSLDPLSRERHMRALVLSQARLDYVAQSTARCGNDGVLLRHSQTRVETSVETSVETARVK